MWTRSSRRLAPSVLAVLASVCAVALVPAVGAPAPADRGDALPDPPAQVPRTGFTRPGVPNDSRGPGGQVVLVSTDVEASKRAVGGTVYFMVLERKDGDTDTPWGGGVKDLVERFRRGVDAGGASSPGLDTGARYLYLYQTVNDRGTDLPVQSTTIQLLPDLKKREITSWGSFTGVGFALPARAGGRDGILPVSTTIKDAGEAEPIYRSPAPAVPATRPYRLSVLPTRRGPFSEQPGGGVARIIQEVLDPVQEPDYVLLLTGSAEGTSARASRPRFRSIWNSYLLKGARSSVYGFTSNRPPVLQPVELTGIGIQVRGGIRPAVAEDAAAGTRDSVAVPAEGRVPVPRPETITPLAAEPAAGPTVPGGPPLLLPGPATPVPVAVPGGSAGGGPSSGGGPSGAGSLAGFGGGGTGGGSAASGPILSQGTQQRQQTAQSQQQQQSGFGSPTQLQQLNLSVQLAVQQNTQVSQHQSQSQNQSQTQAQHQQQNQSQGQSGGPPSELIPEPPAAILALIGLSFLVWLLRRQRASEPPGFSRRG